MRNHCKGAGGPQGIRKPRFLLTFLMFSNHPTRVTFSPGERLCEIIAKAQEARRDGTQVLVVRMNKNKKFQKDQLTAEGYEEFEEFYKE